MKDLVLYVHGKDGHAAECAHYKPLFPDHDVVGLDYRGDTPWEAGAEILAAVTKLKDRYETITLIANSVGAYFCMNAGIDALIRRAYFISPIVDMERLIRGMMRRANVSEAALEAKGAIRTAFGETLSWDWLRYVRAHPIRWNAPTEILYGDRDDMTDYCTVAAFAKARGAKLTVMENGEHWFHTDAQMRFLDAWIRECETARPVGILLKTERLRLFPASREQMEAMIASERDDDLRTAYTEMLNGALRSPERWEWYAIWVIVRTDGARVGDLCFKGLSETGVAEIGYGIAEAYRGRGYAAEAVRAVCRWALGNAEVKALEAETAVGNAASQRVLEKCGFLPTGSFGEEGPRFRLERSMDLKEEAR